MGATKQTDHAGVAKATLPKQFKDKVNFLALVEAIVGPSDPTTWGLQELENVFFQIRDNRWLDTATGAQLDMLGRVLGLHRTSSDDGEYRAALYVQVDINCSQGEPERLLALLETITQGTIHYHHLQPKRIVLVANGVTDTYALDRVVKACGAGDALDIQATTSDTPFIYGRARDAAGVQTTITPQDPHGLGYGVCGSPGTGGVYAALYYATE